ncbi:hypothetical protein Tco_0070925 [Tanacetum coccineum]
MVVFYFRLLRLHLTTVLHDLFFHLSAPKLWSANTSVVNYSCRCRHVRISIPIVFKHGDDPIDAINHVMSFLSAVVTSRYPTTNNQLRNSSNPRQQATINDGREQVGVTRGNRGLLLVTTAKGKDICPNNALNQGGNGMIHGLKIKCYWFKIKQVDKLYNERNLIFGCSRNSRSSSHIQNTVSINGEFISFGFDVIAEVLSPVSTAMLNQESHEQNAKIDRLKQTLSNQLREKESLMKTINELKEDFKKEESRNIDRGIALEKKIKHLDNLVYKRGQSAQTVHMLTKSKIFYDHSTKQAIGFQNPFYLKKAQQLDPKLYDGNNYVLPSDPSPSSTTNKVEVPKELPKVSMVHTSLKKLKHHIAGFDKVVKETTTATAITEGTSLAVDSQINEEIFQRENSVSYQSAPNIDQYFELNELKAQLQEKDKVKMDMDEIETLNIELDHRVSKLIAKNEHLKQTYKQLYDSIKQEQGLVITAIKNELRKLKGKALDDNAVTTRFTDPAMLKIDMEPITPRLLNKRTSHSTYIKHTQDEAAVLKDLVKHVKENYPQDATLESAFRYTKLIQELLKQISKTCPSINNSGEQFMAVTPKNKDKKVRFIEPVTTSINTNTKTDSSSNLEFNKPVLSSTGHSKLNANSESICVTYNGCMLSDKYVNAHVKSKSIMKNSKRKVLKPTGKVFTKTGYIWRPTGQTFTIVGNACPLTRITTTTEVPPRKPMTLESETPKPVVTLVYSRKPKKSKNIDPISKPKTIKYANNKEPSKSWESTVSNVPSSSLDTCRSSKLFSGIWTPAAPSI